jgi:DNA-binding response OmpR family regulator
MNMHTKIPARILVVEDDENLGYLLRENFAGIGVQAIICTSGQEAIQTMRTDEFDLFILDLMLPDMSGFDLAERIRKHLPEKPFLFLTAVKQDTQKFTGYELGAEDYITKPFSFKELEYKVKVILRRHQLNTEQTGLIEVDDLRFDIEDRLLEIGSHTFKLTRREADLLKLFLSRLHIYVTRKEVLEKLWERDDIYTARSMDVYIVRLRKMIANSQSLCIENLYGSGHRITRCKNHEENDAPPEKQESMIP